MSLANLAALLLPLAAAALQEPRPATKPAGAAVETPYFGNAKCPLSGESIDPAKAKRADLEGTPVWFCCGKCLEKGKADPKGTVAKAYPADRVVELKNEVCPVMGEKIGDGKDSVVILGRKVRLCCEDCGAVSKKDWAATLAKASNAKIEDVENPKCPMQENEAASGASIVVYRGKIVRLCCDDCAEGFRKEPDKALARAEQSRKKGPK